MTGGFKWYPGRRAAVMADLSAALAATAEDIVSDAAARQVVPHAESAGTPGHEAGRLASSVSVEPGARTARIVWDAPFAASAYFHPEWEFSRAVHGAAKGRWMDDYMKGGERAGFARDAYRRHIGRKGVLG